MITSPLMEMPAARARWRASRIGWPRVLGPSPDTSITNRFAWKRLVRMLAVANATASPMALPPQQSRRLALVMPWANFWAETASDMRVHLTATLSQPMAAHSRNITAMAPWPPDRIAPSTLGLVMASAQPARCRRASSSSMEPDASTANTSSRSTGPSCPKAGPAHGAAQSSAAKSQAKPLPQTFRPMVRLPLDGAKSTRKAYLRPARLAIGRGPKTFTNSIPLLGITRC